MPLTKHQIYQHVESIMCQFSSQSEDDSELVSVAWHLAEKCYGCKLILKINDEKKENNSA